MPGGSATATAQPHACTLHPPWLPAPQLRQIWADTQRPTALQSDNGLEFQGAVARLCKVKGVKTKHGRPYRPQTQVWN